MEIAIGIIGLLIAWFTYQKTFLAEPKEELVAIHEDSFVFRV